MDRASSVTTRKCRVFPCEAEGSDEMSRCSRHQQTLIAQLMASIEDIAGQAQRFYIGRSNHPEERLLEHFTRQGEHDDEKKQNYQTPRDYLAVLHWSGSWREINEIEECLIRSARSSWPGKCVNRHDRSRGRWYGNWNCVYVSWAFLKRSRTDWDRQHHVLHVTHLDWPLVQPMSALSPVVLKCDLTEKDVRDELKHLKDCRARFHRETREDARFRHD